VTTTRDLQREMEAAAILREQLKAFGDDEILAADTIEGETNLLEMIDAMVAADVADDALIDGLAAHIKAMSDRKARIASRKETRRALLASALEIAGKSKHEAPAGTISRKIVPPKPIVVEESDIPARFFEPQPAKLSLKLLGEALKEREVLLAAARKDFSGEELAAALADIDKQFPAIPGATLSNGGATIQIRR
jgi:hypothetical protein